MIKVVEDMAEEEAWHNGVMAVPKEAVYSLWIAGSSADVTQWLHMQEIPLTEGNPTKGQYIGFRDTYAGAVERHALRTTRVHKMDFVKEDTWVVEIRVDKEAWAAMTTEKVFDIGWKMRLHYVSYPYSSYEWGVWYYHGKSFLLSARGVYVFRPRGLV